VSMHRRCHWSCCRIRIYDHRPQIMYSKGEHLVEQLIKSRRIENHVMSSSHAASKTQKTLMIRDLCPPIGGFTKCKSRRPINVLALSLRDSPPITIRFASDVPHRTARRRRHLWQPQRLHTGDMLEYCRRAREDNGCHIASTQPKWTSRRCKTEARFYLFT
jgi:hypothetical protein